MSNIPSLGNKNSRFQRIKQEYDLPLDREDIVQRVKSILDLGGVQKLVVEINKPIKVERLVVPDAEAPKELPEESEWGLINSSEIIEIDSDSVAPFTRLFIAFQAVGARKFTPRSFVTKSLKVLRKWLDLPEMVPLDSLYSFPIIQDAAVPDDVLVLLSEDVNDVVAGQMLSVRILMEK